MSLFDMLLQGYGLNQQFQNISDAGSTAQQALTDIQAQLPEYTQFKPYTVSGFSGSANVGPSGGISMQLSPEAQALQQQLFSGASGLFGQVTGDPATRQQALYDQIRAIQSPEEERQRLSLENRLAQQGRLGVQTAQFGGTPEALTLAKAQEEARNQAALSALQQSQAEQMQAFNLGKGMLGASYAPESQMLNLLQPSVNLANISTTAGGNLGSMLAQLAGAKATTGINTESLRNALIQQGISALSASGAPTAAQNALGGMLSGSGSDWLQKLGGLLGGSSNDSLGQITSGLGSFFGSQGMTTDQWADVLNTQPNVTVNTSGTGLGTFGQPVDWFGGQ